MINKSCSEVFGWEYFIWTNPLNELLSNFTYKKIQESVFYEKTLKKNRIRLSKTKKNESIIALSLCDEKIE